MNAMTFDHREPTGLARAKHLGRPSETGRFLRINDVIATVGLSRTTIYRMIAAGTFPKQRRLSLGSVGWWEADIDRWNRDRLTPANA